MFSKRGDNWRAYYNEEQNRAIFDSYFRNKKTFERPVTFGSVRKMALEDDKKMYKVLFESKREGGQVVSSMYQSVKEEFENAGRFFVEAGKGVYYKKQYIPKNLTYVYEPMTKHDFVEKHGDKRYEVCNIYD